MLYVFWRRKQWYDGPFNPSSTPSWGGSTRFLLLAGPSTPAGCPLVEFADMWALRMGSAARSSARLKKRRVCRASKGVYNLSDGMLLRRQLHSPRTTSTHHQSSTRWMRRTGRTEKQVGEKLIADRWIRQTNFDVEIIYGIGVGRGDDDIAISLGFLDTSRDVVRKDTRKDGSPWLFLDVILTQNVSLSELSVR